VESKQSSRIFAVLAVVASSLLGYCMSYVERSFAAEPLFNSALAATALDAIVSLAGAVPYITLFIALTIIVNHDGATAD
jgi:ABC-type methionine transport system permease subunit